MTGRYPIDVPLRLLNEVERAIELSLAERELLKDWEPCVEYGYLCWRPRTS